MPNDFNMGELFDDVPVAGQHDPDIAPGTQCPGQGGGNGREAAHPDEVVHFSGDEQDFQETPSYAQPLMQLAMQEWVQLSVWRYECSAARMPFLPRWKRFPAEAAQFRVTPRRKIEKPNRSRNAQGASRMTIDGNDEGNLTGSFAGLRVLDFSTTIAGPHCTRMLADMGAEVIKIETAEGETMRTRPPLRNNCSTVFGQLNVGKKSLVLDLKSPEGDRSRPPAGRNRGCPGREFSSRRDAAVEARLRLAARTQSETDLLLDLRLRPDRPVGGIAGLCAGDSRRLGLRDGASGLSARPHPAGLLRHLSRRRAHRRLCLRRHLGGAVPAREPAARASTSTSRCWNRC